MVNFEKNGKEYKVFHENGVYLGDIAYSDDGYYKFWPELKGGYWEAYMLQIIANKLEELNASWDEFIRNDPVLNEKCPL